jgi:class 3 adenylate cyclase
MRSLSKLMDDAVREQGGVVQGFTGDGIMAAVGAPVAFEDGLTAAAARMLDRSLGAGAIQSTRLARTPCANPAARCALVDPPVTCRVKRRQLGWLRTGPSIGDAQAVGEVAVGEIQPRN